MVSGLAEAHSVSAEFSFNTEFVETINSERPTKVFVRVADNAGLEVIADRLPMSFSEDIAHFSNDAPGCFVLLGNGEGGPFDRPLHSNDLNFNGAFLLMGATLWAELVRDRLPLNSGTRE